MQYLASKVDNVMSVQISRVLQKWTIAGLTRDVIQTPSVTPVFIPTAANISRPTVDLRAENRRSSRHTSAAA